MPSKLTNDQVKQARSLVAATRRIAGEVGQALDVFWAAILEEGQSLPLSDEERILALGRWMETAREREAAADEALDWALQRRAAAVRENDAAAEALRVKLMDVRQTLEGTFGPGQAAIILGLGPDLPEEPALLESFARTAVHKIERPDFVLPEPKVAGNEVDAAVLISDLRPSLERQQRALAALDPEKRNYQVALKHKRAAAGALAFALLWGARYLEALLQLCGESFLAERLRLSSHRASGRRGETGADDPKDGDSKPGDGSAGGETPGETPGETTPGETTPGDTPAEGDEARGGNGGNRPAPDLTVTPPRALVVNLEAAN